MKKNILWTILLSTFLICTAQPSHGSILIGRITHVEGKIFTYGEDEGDWVETGSDTPVGAEDGFYTDEDAKAELVFPNDTMLRMGELTEVEVLRIEKEFTEVYIRNGIVRVYSHGQNTVVKVGTAMGYAEILPQGTADFFTNDRSTEIVPLQEDILFHKTVGADAPETYELRAGSNPLIVSVRHVETGTALANTPWDKWCLKRDMVLKEQAAIRSAHLPSSLQVYSHELEPYGEWERMRYREHYYWFWRPVHVSTGWTPFTRGRWNRWQREYVWISAEPWGWCTHHYGNWINLHGAWRWTPYIHMGVSSPGISLVNLNIHFGKLFRPHWHPGRVAWISTTSHVGWFPLAPWESYYGWRKWGPRTVVVKKIEKLKNRHRIGHYTYRDHSLIVPHKEFRRTGPNRQHDYRKLRVTGDRRNALLRDSKPTYGRHKMAKVQRDVRRERRDDKAKRQRTITKQNSFRPSTPPVGVSRGKAPLTPKKKTILPREETGGRIAKVVKKPTKVSTARPPRKPSTKQEDSTHQSLEQTRPEQSARPSSTLPRTQHVKKNTVLSKSGQSVKRQPSEKRNKWESQQPRQKSGATDRNTAPVKVSKGREPLQPERMTTPPRKETGDRTTKVTKKPPRVSSNPKSGANKPLQVSTARPPREPSAKQEPPTRQSLKQTRPEQSARQSSTLPRAQHIKKNTVPSKSGQSVKRQPSENSKKWASQQSRQKRRETGSNKALRLKRN